MLKLVIFMCTVLFASAMNGSFISETLKIERKNSLELIDDMISDVKQKMDIFTQRPQIIGIFLNETIDFTNKSFTSIADFMKMVNIAIEAYNDKGKIDNTNISEYIKVADTVINNINDATVKTGECILEKLETKLAEIMKLVLATDLLKLYQTKDEAKQCSDNAIDVKSIVKAILCIKAASSKAAWNAMKILKTLDHENVNRFEPGEVKEALTECKSISKFENFQQDLLNIATRVVNYVGK